MAIFQLCDSINTFNRESRRKTKETTRNRSTEMANSVAKDEEAEWKIYVGMVNEMEGEREEGGGSMEEHIRNDC